MQDRPEPEPHQQWLWVAFWQLSHSRQVGMGEGPIPVSEVEAYCRFYDITDLGEREWLLAGVQALDQEYLTVRSEQQASQ
jgi:hypothetical protein